MHDLLRDVILANDIYMDSTRLYTANDEIHKNITNICEHYVPPDKYNVDSCICFIRLSSCSIRVYIKTTYLPVCDSLIRKLMVYVMYLFTHYWST